MKSLSSCQISVLPSTWKILLMLLAMSESFRMLISAVLFPTYLFLSFSLLSYLLFLRLWQDEYYFLNSLIAFPGLGASCYLFNENFSRSSYLPFVRFGSLGHLSFRLWKKDCSEEKADSEAEAGSDPGRRVPWAEDTQNNKVKNKRKGTGFANAMDKERGHLDRVSQQLSLRSAEPTPGTFPFTFASPSSHAMETYFF